MNLAARVSRIVLLGLFLGGAVSAAPQILSEKVVKKKDGPEVSSETILKKYKGGWRTYTQFVKFRDEKSGIVIFEHIYDPKGQKQCSYVYSKSADGMSNIEKTTLLADAFKGLTGKEYKLEDFDVIKGDYDGKTQEVMHWKHQRDDGQIVYAYKRKSSVGCFTKKYLAATVEDLVPMVGLVEAE